MKSTLPFYWDLLMSWRLPGKKRKLALGERKFTAGNWWTWETLLAARPWVRWACRTVLLGEMEGWDEAYTLGPLQKWLLNSFRSVFFSAASWLWGTTYLTSVTPTCGCRSWVVFTSPKSSLRCVHWLSPLGWGALFLSSAARPAIKGK